MGKMKIILISVIIIIIAILGYYFILTPHYKPVEMSGYTFEVPDGNAEVKNNSINYNTYNDTENSLSIKTWACKDINDINGTVNGSIEIGTHLGENMGDNITYNNISVYNKSGNYTYYEADVNNSCMIIITSNNLDTITHIIETLKKPKLNITNNPFNMTAEGLITADSNNNTTTDNQTTPT